MASTLEKLLTIQGAEEQLSIETLSGATGGPQEREEARGGIPPPIGPSAANTGPAAGPPGTGSPPDMLEVWREAFRVFSRYAPAIRAAAALPEGYEEAGRLFLEALERVKRMASAGEDGEIIAFGVYDMLDDVWQRARRGCENDKPRGNGEATGERNSNRATVE